MFIPKYRKLWLINDIIILLSRSLFRNGCPWLFYGQLWPSFEARCCKCSSLYWPLLSMYFICFFFLSVPYRLHVFAVYVNDSYTWMWMLEHLWLLQCVSNLTKFTWYWPGNYNWTGNLYSILFWWSREVFWAYLHKN